MAGPRFGAIDRVWERWQLARDNYRAAVHVDEVKPSAGDWGLWEAVQIDELLPEFSLPRAAIRNEWLDRLVRNPPTSPSLGPQQRNARATRSHAKRRLRARDKPSL